MSFSRPRRIHLHSGTDVVVTVRSSIKALMGGCRIPVLDRGPLHSTSATFTNTFKARANRITEIDQLWSLSWADASWIHAPWCHSQPEVSIVVQDEVVDLAEYVVSVEGCFSLWGIDSLTKSSQSTARSPFPSRSFLINWVTISVCSKYPGTPGMLPFCAEYSEYSMYLFLRRNSVILLAKMLKKIFPSTLSEMDQNSSGLLFHLRNADSLCLSSLVCDSPPPPNTWSRACSGCFYHLLDFFPSGFWGVKLHYRGWHVLEGSLRSKLLLSVWVAEGAM